MNRVAVSCDLLFAVRAASAAYRDADSLFAFVAHSANNESGCFRGRKQGGP
jgi:hypothetical protein